MPIKGERLTGQVNLGGMRVSDQVADFIEVTLRGGAFGEFAGLPMGDEVGREGVIAGEYAER